MLGSMNDGRFATNYKASCSKNTRLQEVAGVQPWDNTSYRQYLQVNGKDALIQEEKANPCGPYQCADLGDGIKKQPVTRSILQGYDGATITPYESLPSAAFAPYSAQ